MSVYFFSKSLFNGNVPLLQACLSHSSMFLFIKIYCSCLRRFDVVSLVSLISPLQLPQVRFDKAVMGCGTSRNVVAPQSITIEDKPRKDFVNEETPVCTEKSVETIPPPSPTPSQRSTSLRISIHSKSDRPGSRGGKSEQEVDLMGEGENEVGISGQNEVVSTREPSAVSKVNKIEIKLMAS